MFWVYDCIIACLYDYCNVFIVCFFSRPHLSNDRAIGIVVVRPSVRQYVTDVLRISARS